MSVHAVSFLYYVYEPGTESCVMFDAFGRPLHPLRYVLWTISVSSMCLSLYLVVEKLLNQTKEPRPISSFKLRDMLIDALLGCYGTFVLGFLGSRIMLESTHIHNYCLFCLSSCCFYLMLHRLYTMLNFVTHTKYIILSGAAPQFQAVQSARATEKMRVLPSYPHSRSRVFLFLPVLLPSLQSPSSSSGTSSRSSGCSARSSLSPSSRSTSAMSSATSAQSTSSSACRSRM